MATMRDVAERAGVSVTTVSHVVNGTRPVSDKLRQRVLAAMDELGYQPNVLARSLRRGKTHTIGIIVPDIANPFFAEVARGIEDESFAHGYSVMLCNTDLDLDKEQLYANALIEKQVDGILFVAAGTSSEHIKALQQRNVPLVIMDRRVPGVAVDAVLADNRRGGRLATDHLIQLGHRRIACIGGPAGLTTSAERVAGYRDALQEADISVDDALIVAGNFQYDGGYKAAQDLLALADPPTAIFACNDLMAVGAISAVLAQGLSVPAGISVAGFDDVRLAALMNPALTTVGQPKYEMGAQATELLLARMREPDAPPRIRILDTRLRVRDSTGPL